MRNTSDVERNIEDNSLPGHTDPAEYNALDWRSIAELAIHMPRKLCYSQSRAAVAQMLQQNNRHEWLRVQPKNQVRATATRDGKTSGRNQEGYTCYSGRNM
eukprot:3421422-Amphidinium_carterae.1